MNNSYNVRYARIRALAFTPAKAGMKAFLAYKAASKQIQIFEGNGGNEKALEKALNKAEKLLKL